MKCMERAWKIVRVRNDSQGQEMLGKRVKQMIDNCVEIDVANAVSQLKKQKTE